jgi:urea transport system permease protein
MQQAFRSTFGAKEVSADLPEWMLGSFKPTPDIDIPINGVFVMVLAALVTAGVYIFMYRSHWGLRVRATVQNRVMAGAVGINTKKVDRITFALGCGIAGIAGAAFTTIASTGPTTGTLYIVDSFMVVVFGGAASLMGTIASAFGIAQAQSILQFFMTSSMGKVSTLLVIVGILMMKPEGLFASKLRK